MSGLSTLAARPGALPSLRSEAEARRGMYGLLALVFRRPISLAELQSIQSLPLQDVFVASGAPLENKFSGKDRCLLLDELAIDYTQLFHGPRNHLALYESVHRGHDGGELNGELAAAVNRFYDQISLIIDGGSSELPDHLSVEIDCMAELTHREAQAWNEGSIRAVQKHREQQNVFLINHLGVWGPDLGRQVADRAQTSFYAGFGRLLEEFLESEIVEARGQQ